MRPPICVGFLRKGRLRLRLASFVWALSKPAVKTLRVLWPGPQLVFSLAALLCGCVNTTVVEKRSTMQEMILFEDTNPLTDFDAQMVQSRVPLEAGGLDIETCADLFGAIDRGDDLSYVFLTRPFATYSACFELPLLCHSTAAEHNDWIVEGLSEQVYRHLDLGTFGTSLWPRRASDSHRFLDFNLPEPDFSASGFSIETEDWFYGLWFRAIADFDGDGIADVLVEFVDHAKRASYFEISPIILSRDMDDPDIRGRRVVSGVLDDTLTTWPDDPMTCDRSN